MTEGIISSWNYFCFTKKNDSLDHGTIFVLQKKNMKHVIIELFLFCKKIINSLSQEIFFVLQNKKINPSDHKIIFVLQKKRMNSLDQNWSSHLTQTRVVNWDWELCGSMQNTVIGHILESTLYNCIHFWVAQSILF